MKPIWKFPLEITDEQLIGVPGVFSSMTVGEQAGELCLWATVDTDAPPAKRRIRIVGTGHHCDDTEDYQFVGTAVTHRGLVWHVFDKGFA